MLAIFQVLIFVTFAVSKCCIDCLRASDQGCLICIEGVLTLGVCNEFCPSGFIQIDNNCIQISRKIFVISFSDPISLLTNQIRN